MAHVPCSQLRRQASARTVTEAHPLKMTLANIIAVTTFSTLVVLWSKWPAWDATAVLPVKTRWSSVTFTRERLASFPGAAPCARDRPYRSLRCKWHKCALALPVMTQWSQSSFTRVYLRALFIGTATCARDWPYEGMRCTHREGLELSYWTRLFVHEDRMYIYSDISALIAQVKEGVVSDK